MNGRRRSPCFGIDCRQAAIFVVPADGHLSTDVEVTFDIKDLG
jgi:hypothetical protein